MNFAIFAIFTKFYEFFPVMFARKRKYRKIVNHFKMFPMQCRRPQILIVGTNNISYVSMLCYTYDENKQSYNNQINTLTSSYIYPLSLVKKQRRRCYESAFIISIKNFKG